MVERRYKMNQMSIYVSSRTLLWLVHNQLCRAYIRLAAMGKNARTPRGPNSAPLTSPLKTVEMFIDPPPPINNSAAPPGI